MIESIINNNQQSLKKHKLIVTIVKKGMGSKVVEISKKVGAGGGTIILGRGTANKSIYEDLLGIAFEPEKEIIFSLVQEDYVDGVLNAIMEKAQLNKPGRGIGFILDINKYIGIAHLLQLQHKETKVGGDTNHD